MHLDPISLHPYVDVVGYLTPTHIGVSINVRSTTTTAATMMLTKGSYYGKGHWRHSSAK